MAIDSRLSQLRADGLMEDRCTAKWYRQSENYPKDIHGNYRTGRLEM